MTSLREVKKIRNYVITSRPARSGNVVAVEITPTHIPLALKFREDDTGILIMVQLSNANIFRERDMLPAWPCDVAYCFTVAGARRLSACILHRNKRRGICRMVTAHSGRLTLFFSGCCALIIA